MPGAKRSRTAQGVVAERALLTDLGVIDDPVAASMLEPGFRRLVDVLRRLPARTWCRAITLAGLGARVAWMDAQIDAALADGIGQVAMVGAGYDSRAWRMRRDGVRWVELDRPSSQRAKRQGAPGPGPTFVEADLRSDDAMEALVRGGLDAYRPAVFVFEGVTMYLDELVLRDQLHRLADGGATGSRLLADFTPPAGSGTGRHTRQLWLQRLARGGSGERFLFTATASDARALVVSAGWDVDAVTSLRDAARSLVPPRSGLPVDEVHHGKTLLAARTGAVRSPRTGRPCR